MLSKFNLDEPIVTAMVNLLTANLPATVTAMNETITDDFTLEPVAQYLPVMPYAPVFQGGLPLVGVAGLGATFEDDLVFDVDARHRFAVVVVVQNADYVTLAWQLRRLCQCVAYTVQADRVLGPGHSVLEQQGGLWGVRFVDTEPGPLLGDIDPENPGAAPKAWRSWTGLVFEGVRKEVNAGS